MIVDGIYNRSQTQLVYEYMQKHGGITPKEALQYCACMRLAARIADLKKKGYNVGAEDTYEMVRGGKRRFKRYFLIEED